MRKPFVAGNWKMNGSKSKIDSLLSGLVSQENQFENVDVAVCPPSVYLDYVVQKLSVSRIKVGGQNMAQVNGEGAYTGEVSAQMLLELGCDYVILGHSERRTLYGETDALVADKVAVALEAGLVPILCVGETLEEREQDITGQVVEKQMQAVIDKVGIEGFKTLVVAYEPVWAIGTGRTATPEQAQEVHAFIRGLIAMQDQAVADQLIIQYGGSMKPDNAAELLSQPDIDGGLIGGASLVADDFVAICAAAGEACSK